MKRSDYEKLIGIEKRKNVYFEMLQQDNEKSGTNLNETTAQKKRNTEKTLGLDIWNQKPQRLSNDEVLRLIRDYREKGDLNARDKVIYGNMRFVRWMVFNMVQSNFITLTTDCGFEDYCQEGIIEIQKSIDKFDYENYNFQFSTYIGKRLTNAFSKMKTHKDRKKRAGDKNLISLDSGNSDEEDRNLYNFVKDDKVQSESDIVNRMEFQRIMKEILPILPKSQRDIVSLYFVEGHTMEEVATIKNCTRQYIDLVLKDVMPKIQNMVINGVSQDDIALKGVKVGKSQKIIQYYKKLVNVASEFKKKFGVEGIIQFRENLPEKQKEVFDSILYDPRGRINNNVRDVVIEKMQLALERGKVAGEIKPLTKRQKIEINLNEDIIQKYGGRAFLNKYFLPILTEREQKVFKCAFLQFEGQSRVKMAESCGINQANFSVVYNKVLDKLKNTDFEILVDVIDNAESFGGKVVNINEQKMQWLEERKRFVENHGGIVKMSEFVLPILNKTEQIVLSKMYLWQQYDSLTSLSSNENISVAQVVTADKTLREKIESVDIDEFESIQRETEDIIKNKGYIGKIDGFLQEHGGEEFLEERFLPNVEVLAHRMIFVERILRRNSIENTFSKLNLDESQKNYWYVSKICSYLRNRVIEWHNGIPDFDKEVREFYAQKQFKKRHPENFENIVLGEYEAETTDDLQENLTIDNVGKCEDRKKREQFMTEYLSRYGKLRDIVRDFLPTVKTVLDKLVFKTFFIEAKTSKQVRKECGITSVEFNNSKVRLITKLDNFYAEKNKNQNIKPKSSGNRGDSGKEK